MRLLEDRIRRDGIVREGVGGALKVGGVLLTDSARRPDKELRRLSAHPGTEEPTGVPSAIPLHGALVRAVFDHETHGPLALTGVAPAEVRNAVNDPGFLAGLVDFLMSHEPTLLAFSAATGTAPEAVVHAHAVLSGQNGDGDF